jgi:hypothetical protein
VAADQNPFAILTLFMVRVLSPPLPLVCVHSESGEEYFCNSHSLISTIASRLIKDVRQQDWQEDVLMGPHMHAWLDAQAQRVAGGGQEIFTYESCCSYTRAVLNRLSALDGGSGDCDFRFLQDTGRVSWSRHRELCLGLIAYYRGLLAMCGRGSDVTTEQLEVLQKRYISSRRSYESVLQDALDVLNASYGAQQDVEKGVEKNIEKQGEKAAPVAPSP